MKCILKSNVYFKYIYSFEERCSDFRYYLLILNFVVTKKYNGAFPLVFTNCSVQISCPTLDSLTNLQIVNSGNLSATNPNHVDVSDT